MKPLVRFRIGSYGCQVFNSGHWVPADDKIRENIVQMLYTIAPRLY